MADTALWFFDSPTPTSEGGSLKSIQDARGINRFSYLSKCKYLHKDSLAEYEMAYLGRMLFAESLSSTVQFHLGRKPCS